MGAYCILFSPSYFSSFDSLYKICSRSHIFSDLGEQFFKLTHYKVTINQDYFALLIVHIYFLRKLFELF